MKKTLLALALSATTMTAPAYALVYEDFTIDEGSVADAIDKEVIGNKFTGGYSEIFTLQATLNPGQFTFESTAFAEFSSLRKNASPLTNGQNAGSQIVEVGGIGSGVGGQGYGLYALFTASGTASTVTSGPNAGQIQFNGNAGTFQLYIDVDADTEKTLGLTASSGITLVNDTDDYMIAYSDSLQSLANVIGNPGAFDLWFDEFTLTNPEGEAYFVKPRPFHLITNVDGDFDNILANAVVFDAKGQANIEAGGELSAVFVVPEPSTVALLGLGLTGLGLSLRRRKTA